MTSPPGTSSNDIMWPTLGKRGAIAKPAEQPTKKARRRELRNRNLKLHLVFEAGDIPEALEEKIAAYFHPKWLTAFWQKFGDLRCAQSLPTQGPGLYRCPQAAMFDEITRMSKKFVYWSREFPRGPTITRSIMEPLLGKEILLTYANRAGKTTEMYPKVVKAVFANSARLACPDNPDQAFTISFDGVWHIFLEVKWFVPNPEYRPNWRDYCPHCHQYRPGRVYCGCID